MTSANINYFLQANITLLSKTDFSTTTIKLINRPRLADTSEECFPILKDISKVGTSSDGVSILPNSGSIQVLNTIGSFGVERKFSDILQRYSIHDQNISVYYGVGSITDENPTLTLCFKAKIINWEDAIDSGEQILRINFDNRIFSKKFITRQVYPDELTTLAPNSLFPIVFGSNVEVPAIKTATDFLGGGGTYMNAYGYATTYSTTFVNGGIQKYYTKNLQNDYVEIGTTSSATSAHVTVGPGTGANAGANWGSDELAVRFAVNAVGGSSPTAFLMTSLRWRFKGQPILGGLTPGGDIIVSIYESNYTGSGATSSDYPQDKPIAQSKVVKSAWYSQLNSGADFWIDFFFSNPIVIYKLSYYFVSIQMTQYSGLSATDFTSGGIATAGSTINSMLRVVGKAWEGFPTPATGIACEIFGVKFTDSPSPVDTNGLSTNVNTKTGLGLSTVAALYKYDPTTSPAPNAKPTLRDDFIFTINGLKDDSSGTITGSASSQINYIDYAINLLEREWSGSAFAASGKWDFTAYGAGFTALRTTPGKAYKLLCGATQGLTTFEDFIRDACKEHATKVVIRNDGKLALYTWGGTYTNQFVFNQENSAVKSFTALDTSYVVNRVSFAYQKSLRDLDVKIILPNGIVTNFLSSLHLYTGLDGNITSYIDDSVSLYGTKQLNDDTLNWIADATSARNLGIYYLINYNTTPLYVTLEAAFNDTITAQLLETCYITQPCLSAYYGTSPNATLPYYSGEEVDILDGYTLTRAELYRAQIEEKYLSFENKEAPRVVFVCRILTNSQDPT